MSPSDISVDGVAHQRAGQFVMQWQPRLAALPTHQLDGTWSSLGVIDLLLSSMRDADPTDASALKPIAGAAAYAVLIVQAICHRLGLPARLAQNPRGELLLISGDTTIPFERELLTLIVPGRPVSSPRLDRVVANASPEDDIVTIYAYTCLAEAIARSEDAPELWNRIRRAIAQETSDRAARVLPELKLSHLPELYVDGLSIPVEGTATSYLFGDDAIDCFAAFIRDNGLRRSAVLELAERLIRWPDMRIAEAAFVIYLAHAPRILSPSAVAFGAARLHRNAELRRQLVRARQSLFGLSDWAEGGAVGADLLPMVESELRVGLIPLLSLERRRLRSKFAPSYLGPLASALLRGELDRAAATVEEWSGVAPEAIDLHTQRLLLLSVRGGAESEVEDELTRLLKAAPESPRVLDLVGIRALERGELARAEQCYHDAISRCGRDVEFLSHVANNYGWTLMLLNQFMHAAMIFDIGLREAANPVTLLLNKSYCVRALDSLAEAEAVERRLLRLAPFERRVICMHLFEWLRIDREAPGETEGLLSVA